KPSGTTIKIWWKTDWKRQEVYYSVRLSGKPVAWFLVGFSDHGKYRGSDFCKFDGANVVDGYIGRGLAMETDIQQDCVFYGRNKNDGSFRFMKKFQTCDMRDYAVEVGTTQFVVATGIGDEKYLTEATFEANITKGNEHLVHHMEIYQCENPGHDFQWLYNGDCNSEHKPRETHGCSKVIAAWAFGAGPVVYPPEAGMPLGGPGFYPYLMVEIHYNNVERERDVVDNSGFTITYTDQLRPYDAGILELGLIYSDANSIPPRQSAFPITGYCVADCTQNFPPEGINIFATQLHAHLTGRKLWTSHYRNGVKIGEVNRENHYSPHWQHVNMLGRPINVLPGGYGIEDEMCVNYIHYYPASEVEVCKSAIDNSTLRAFFEQMGVNPTMEISEMYKAAKWSRERYSNLQELFNVGDLNMHCLQHDGDPFPNHPSGWQHVPQPEIRVGPFDIVRPPFECPAIND
ncbi:Tyramine beta-hydroxylase, partial [Toxocara canis]